MRRRLYADPAICGLEHVTLRGRRPPWVLTLCVLKLPRCVVPGRICEPTHILSSAFVCAENSH